MEADPPLVKISELDFDGIVFLFLFVESMVVISGIIVNFYIVEKIYLFQLVI